MSTPKHVPIKFTNQGRDFILELHGPPNQRRLELTFGIQRQVINNQFCANLAFNQQNYLMFIQNMIFLEDGDLLSAHTLESMGFLKVIESKTVYESNEEGHLIGRELCLACIYGEAFDEESGQQTRNLNRTIHALKKVQSNTPLEKDGSKLICYTANGRWLHLHFSKTDVRICISEFADETKAFEETGEDSLPQTFNQATLEKIIKTSKKE